MGKRIKIGSVNIQNIRGNTIFVQSVLKETEILFIQEHWLFKFEEKEFKTLIPNTDHYARFIDEDSPINHSERIRGYGGVAILWHPNLTPYIRPLPDGTNHIIAIELEAEPKPLCMINAYMPCRGRKNTAHQYSESIDIIREMVSKYSKSHTIVLGGDFNASLHREPPNNIDKMLRDCCSEAGLTTPDNYPVKPTFYHHDNKSSSQIDYLFTLKDQIKDGIRAIKIWGHQNLNTSDHVLITGTINISQIKKKSKSLPTTTLYRKPKWNKCDDQMYLNSVDTYLDRKPKCQMDKTNFQLVLDVMHLANVLHTATENAIPNHKANGNRNSKKRGRAPWNEEIGQASRRTKQAFHRWKIDGSIKEPRNALYK